MIIYILELVFSFFFLQIIIITLTLNCAIHKFYHDVLKRDVDFSHDSRSKLSTVNIYSDKLFCLAP